MYESMTVTYFDKWSYTSCLHLPIPKKENFKNKFGMYNIPFELLSAEFVPNSKTKKIM